jgi:hypothetical protein
MILQRGDVIHLAIPLSGYGHAPDAAETKRLVAELTAYYLTHGVTIGYWSAGSLCAHPTVVAVFREPLVLAVG